MKKRILLLFLAGVMLLLPLTGCNNSSGDQKGTTQLEGGNDTSDGNDRYDSEGYLKDDLPDGLAFDDEIKVLYWTETDIGEFNPDEDTIFTIDKAIYSRDRNVENRLSITFNWLPTKGHYESQNAFVNTVQNAYNGGEATRYDIIATYSQSAGVIAMYGLIVEVQDNKYIDLSKPWWPDSLTESFTVNDKLFFVSGDLSTTFLSQMISVYFNKAFFPDDNLYDLVYDGDWTMDKMMELIKNKYVDYDNTETKSLKDQFGVICPWYVYVDGFFYGSDLITVDRDIDGALRVSDSYISERADTVAENLKTLFHKSDDGYFGNSADIVSIFARGDAAFMVAPGATVLTYNNMRNTAVDYGILPMPKYDSQQKEYKTVTTNLISLYCIFAGSNQDQIDRAGAVLEAMASDSHRGLAPLVFNECLQLRYAKDGDTGKMYDLIRNGVVFDVGRVYASAALKGITQDAWQRCVVYGSDVWGSKTATVDAQLQELLDKLQDSFDSID